jgi:hypothetical protein
VNSGIDVTGHIEQQVFAHQTHQVDTRIPHVVFRVILAPTGAHVAVDGVKPLGDCAGAVDIGFFGNDDFLVLAPEPVPPRPAPATRMSMLSSMIVL